VERAIDHGILVVAAAGNESRGTAKQDPFEYPAAYEHVLSVGASTPVGGWAPFSNQSPTNDLLAPGIGVYAAVAAGFSLPQGFTCSPAPTPTEAGWCQVAGTSFATPITAAAAAFVWSQRPHLKAAQVAAALRSGARPAVGQKTHRSSRFGFGRLDVPRALVATAPLTDAFEPNGDIPMVRGTQGFIRKGAILSASRRKRVVFATMDFAEDFSDVYEADVLRKVHRLRIVLRHPGSGRRTDDLTVCVWRQSSRSVLLGSSGGRRLACSHQHGARTDTLSVRLPKGTRRVFVEIHPTATSTFSGRYTLAVRRA